MINYLFDFIGEPTCRGLIHRLARRAESDIIIRSVVRRSIGKQFICNIIDKVLFK